ncbi:hypothetical protein K469DRAFT_486778, partial [Zopfia rhizophila CBS 207.26]
YELRKSFDRKVVTTWFDKDESGNYDPKEEAKKLRKAKLKKKGKQKVQKAKVPKKIVRLQFAHFGNVLNITDEEQNWPDGWSELDSEDESQIAYRKWFYRKNTPGVSPQIPIPNPDRKVEDVDDLTGYPAARGCTECYKHHQKCTMIGDNFWPCQQCQEDGEVCQPIIQPKVKAKCLRCIGLDEEQYCSFELAEVSNQSGMCDQCIEDECETCVAGPAEGYELKRISMDAILYGPDRKHIQCTECRYIKKKCSLKKTSDKPPCNYCKKKGLGCTFLNIPKLEIKKEKGKGKSKERTSMVERGDGWEAMVMTPTWSDFFSEADLKDLVEDGDEGELERENTPMEMMTDTAGNRGEITSIWTSFSHPIIFNSLNESDCHFCDLPTFSFVGHFERKVHVLRWLSGLGYTELQGGHREEHEQTRMCQFCSMSRVQIMICETHELKPLEDLDLDFDDAVNGLIAVEPRSDAMKYQLQRWCSMCFSLATFICCTLQPSLITKEGEGGEEEAILDGCGLCLCDKCEVRLREEFGGDSSEMATAIDKEPKAREDQEDLVVVRADVGFLMKEGLLM